MHLVALYTLEWTDRQIYERTDGSEHFESDLYF
jgi:hypothetical protein